MRKVIAGLFISLDGITESPDQWQESFDEDMAAELQAHIENTDTIVLGRVTYQEWADYWPNSDDELFAPYINNSPKYVVSTTLNEVQWGDRENITLFKSIEEVGKLKEQSGKHISVAGSPTLVRALIEQDILDELTLYIHPVVAGKGKRLFGDGSDLKRMDLVNARTTRTGNVITTHRLRK